MSALPEFSGSENIAMNLKFAMLFMDNYLKKKDLNSKLESYEVNLYLKVLLENKEIDKAI
jgi:hypothetical protein